jgi:hypothetical protein
MFRHLTCLAMLAALPACRPEAQAASVDRAAGDGAQAASRGPNEYGRIPILEYHKIGDADSRWARSRDHFRHDLEILYERGYRPVTVSQLVDGDLNLPAGLSPVVFTFDDASPEQFRYIARGDSLDIDPQSGIGIWLDMHRRHPDWGNRATFCLLPAASDGHAFFGDRGIEGQKTEWRFRKLRTLVDLGFELCGHTLWHAQLHRYSDIVVQEQIARGVLAIDSAVPGYRVRSFALPLGSWPVHRELATRGRWRDPHGGRETSYAFDAVLEVSGGPVPSPHAPDFDPHRLRRIQVVGSALEAMLDHLDRSGERYVSDGNPARLSGPPKPLGGDRRSAAKHAVTRSANTGRR